MKRAGHPDETHREAGKGGEGEGPSLRLQGEVQLPEADHVKPCADRPKQTADQEPPAGHLGEQGAPVLPELRAAREGAQQGPISRKQEARPDQAGNAAQTECRRSLPHAAITSAAKRGTNLTGTGQYSTGDLTAEMLRTP